MSERVVLIYIGRGAYLPGVPARDLNEADLREIADRLGYSKEQLIGTLLYRAAGKMGAYDNKVTFPQDNKSKESE